MCLFYIQQTGVWYNHRVSNRGMTVADAGADICNGLTEIMMAGKFRYTKE